MARKELPAIEKLNAKLDKKFGGKEIVIQVVERTGYYQDFRNVVEEFRGNLVFVGDTREEDFDFGTPVYPYLNRAFECNVTNVKSGETKVAKGFMKTSLHGNILKYEGLNTRNEEEIFANINENTYWPNGYNVGKYNEGGHDYELYSFLEDD